MTKKIALEKTNEYKKYKTLFWNLDFEKNKNWKSFMIDDNKNYSQILDAKKKFLK